ncbi:unnamed protein product [Pseudo-nitzschia multistriata]|uniref:Prolyl 4-hydroxylase alpha subunit domain-containing protein n=2 Tax=Pseudo-nitzschia multistriata TaxID=183589 RepID=A0A448Z4I3_9STRA|nr:unnamed protein product [Pseudo-nitzschia multistriata]
MSEPDIMNGADFSLNSFVSHEFELREKPSPSTGVCKSEDKTCSSAFFAVSENADQVVTVHEGLEIEFLDDQVRAQLKARGIMGTCETKAKDRLQKAGTNKEMIEDAMDGLVKCVESELTISLSKASEELAFESKIRTNMASMMENYTCVDTELNSTEPVRESRWRGARDRKGRDVQVLLDRPASKIMFVKDFISQAECDAMAEAAAPKLHKASVADGKGGSKFSEHRKAMQAGIKVDWEKEHEGNHIAVLSRRVYDFTNYILNLGIAEHGQEDLMSIQYFGRGLNDTEPDRYTPHCDGDCSGLPHKTGTRMATMVMYW